MLLKTSPDKVAEAVVHIEQMRARQQQEVAIERGAQAGAAIIGAAPPPIPQ
jgi:molybdopterin biosynthesis enzyme